MAVQSMTGFSRAAREFAAAVVVWELRSVNGKAVEVRLRLPQGFDRLEPAARQAIQKRFARGSFQATLQVQRLAPTTGQPTINEQLLKDLAGLARRLEEQYGMAPARADGLLALRGVLEMPDTVETQAERDGLDACALATLDAALDSLAEARLAEGDAIASIISGQIDTIAGLVDRAEADPSRDPSAIRARLAQQVALLTDAAAGFDETRLHMEAAFLATKADIREEIDRLRAHVASARALLSGEGPIGRRLDFLAQEFNRESNTLCAKSNAGTVTAIGLELKAVVDQFREQVQNLE